MKTLRILDSCGDRVVTFDSSTEAREARALFEQALARGGAAFKVHRGAGQPNVRVDDFLQLEDETIVVPRLAGG